MVNSEAAHMPLTESTPQSPSFEVPEYNITFGKDRILEWKPPVESPELALALSYHFPKQNSLKGKMRAAMRLFLRSFKKRSEQAQPSIASPSIEKESTSRVEGERSFRATEISRTTPATKEPPKSGNLIHSGQPNEVSQKRAPTPDVSPRLDKIKEIIWEADTGQEVEVKNKKRQYTQKERLEVSKNRGNVCDEHRKKRQKCNPLTCPRNKQFLKNNSEGQCLVNQGQNVTLDDSKEDSNGSERIHPGSSSVDKRPPPRKGNPEEHASSIGQTPREDTSNINNYSPIVPDNTSPNLQGTRSGLAKVFGVIFRTISPDSRSPGVSPGGFGSPQSTKSPHTTYFDDAWVDSPHRLDNNDTHSNPGAWGYQSSYGESGYYALPPQQSFSPQSYPSSHYVASQQECQSATYNGPSQFALYQSYQVPQQATRYGEPLTNRTYSAEMGDLITSLEATSVQD